MKFTFNKSKKSLQIFCLFLISSTAAAASDSTVIKCKTSNDKNVRTWKFTQSQNVTRFWTLNEDKFYPFCTHGLSLEFANGLLCAFKKDRQVGTIATYIDIQNAEITDILIKEDTILEDPSTWVQKTRTPCEMIRQ